jgi:sarcosine oxidase, subunit gamma
VAEIVLKPLTALGADAPLVEQIGPWTITERVDVALASLALRRGREADLRGAAANAGLPLPSPSRAETGVVYGAFWMTPEMWMVEAPFASHEDIRARLLAVFGDAASITEQTDAWLRFDLAGAGLARLFERLSNLDLAQAAPGMASRTVIDHQGCYVIKRSDAQITLYGPRSSARSLHHALAVAARSAG